MTRDDRRTVLLDPLKTWAGMIALVLLSAVYAHLPQMPAKLVANLALAAAQIGLIAMFLMQLRKAAAVVRLAAMTGVVWASFLFLFTFADFLTR